MGLVAALTVIAALALASLAGLTAHVVWGNSLQNPGEESAEETEAVRTEAEPAPDTEPEVLSPAPEEKAGSEEAVCVVCVDPGHGGSDRGSSCGDRLEKDDNLALGLALRDSLENRNISVIMTREKDEYVSLPDRVAAAEAADADCYLSLHRNSYEGEEVHGLEIWLAEAYSDTAWDLAEQISTELQEVGVQEARGIRTGTQDGDGSYYVLRNTTMPAVLVELGFLQDEEDNRLFDTQVKEYAEAMADAVLTLYTQS